MLFEEDDAWIAVNFAGMHGSCMDVTAIHLKTKEVNISLGCYCCLSEGKHEDDEVYVGVPINKLDAVVNGLKGLRRAIDKPVAAGPKEEDS